MQGLCERLGLQMNEFLLAACNQDWKAQLFPSLFQPELHKHPQTFLSEHSITASLALGSAEGLQRKGGEWFELGSGLSTTLTCLSLGS